MRHLNYPEIPYHALLRRAAERWPDREALVFGDRRLTFGDLDRDADRVAAGLVRLGAEKGDRIAIFAPNSPEYETVFFGGMRIGAVPTPLNPSYREREVAHQLRDSGAVVAFVHVSLLPIVERVRSSVPGLRHVVVIGGSAPGTLSLDEFTADESGEVPPVDLAPNDLAALPYSSGTTGGSKGVMLTQRNLVCNAFQFVDATQTTPDDTLLIFLPLYHIYGVALFGTAITAGARQVLMERFDLAEVMRVIQEEHVSELYVVPPVMLALATVPDLRPQQFRSLRFIMSAAAPLAGDVARRVAERLQVSVMQGYGMTEASPLTHMVPLDRAGESYDTVGVVASDTECRIVDLESGERQLPAGEVGEVVIEGPQVMAGYWNAPEVTAATLRDGRLYTGDVGTVDTDGNLTIVDRLKEMIKYKAFSIAPAELEAVLLEHRAVADCAVVGEPDPEAGEVPHAYVVLRPGSQVTPEELQNFVAERVAGYKQIRRLDVIDSIPRTPSGKILRRVLREPAVRS